MTKIHGVFLTNFFNVMMGIALLPAIEAWPKLYDLIQQSERSILTIQQIIHRLQGQNGELWQINAWREQLEELQHHYTSYVLLMIFSITIALFALKYLLECDRLDGILLNLNKGAEVAEVLFLLGRIAALASVALLAQYIRSEERENDSYLVTVIPFLLLAVFPLQDITILCLWKMWTKVRWRDVLSGTCNAEGSLILPYSIGPYQIKNALICWLVLDLFLFGLFVDVSTRGALNQTLVVSGVLGIQIVVPSIALHSIYFGHHENPDRRICALSWRVIHEVRAILAMARISVTLKIDSVLTENGCTNGTCRLEEGYLDKFLQRTIPSLLDLQLPASIREHLTHTEACTKFITALTGEVKRGDLGKLLAATIIPNTNADGGKKEVFEQLLERSILDAVQVASKAVDRSHSRNASTAKSSKRPSKVEQPSSAMDPGSAQTVPVTGVE